MFFSSRAVPTRVQPIFYVASPPFIPALRLQTIRPVTEYLHFVLGLSV